MRPDGTDANTLGFTTTPGPGLLTGMPFQADLTLGPELGTYIKIAHI